MFKYLTRKSAEKSKYHRFQKKKNYIYYFLLWSFKLWSPVDKTKKHKNSLRIYVVRDPVDEYRKILWRRVKIIFS